MNVCKVIYVQSMLGQEMDKWDNLAPSVTVKDLLRSLPDLSVLADGAGTRQPIRWVHVSELTDPTPYLRGGELLLIAGLHLPRTADEAERYVERLASVPIVALGFGIDPVHHAVPERLIVACQAHKMMLLRVPPELPFIAVSEAHVRILEESRRRAGEATARAQRQIVRAAARTQSVQAIVDTLGTQLQASIMLTDHQAGTRWSAGQMPPTATKLEEELARSLGARQSAATHEPGLHTYSQALEAPGRVLTLTISSPEPPVPLTHDLIGITSTVISLIAGRTPAVRLTAFGEAVARYALEADIHAVEPAVSRAFDVDATGGGNWSVLMATPPRQSEARKSSEASWEAAFAEAAQSALRFMQGEISVAVMADPARAQIAADQLATSACHVALSDPCAWRDLPQAARQGRRRLMVARLHAPSRAGPSSRFLPTVYSLIDKGSAEGFSAAHLAPLLQRPPSDAYRLLTTLQGWLEHDGNWDRTATVLGVHRNTVRNRIHTIERLLNRDLQSPNVRTDLFLALQWHDFDRPASGVGPDENP